MDRFPDRIEGLALLAPVVVADDDARALPVMVKARSEASLFERMQPEITVATRSIMSNESPAAVRILQRDHIPAIAIADHDFIAALRGGAYGFEECPTAQFDGPALVIAGRQDTAVGYRQAMELMEAFPRGTFTALDGTGHLLEAERTELVRALLGDWLDRLEPAV